MTFRRARGERTPRWGTLALLALQLLLALAIPIGDAELEAASFATPTHVEAPTDEACGDRHDHLFCQLCRALGLFATAGAPQQDLGLVPLWTGALVAPFSGHLPTGPLGSGSLGARAPPVA